MFSKTLSSHYGLYVGVGVGVGLCVCSIHTAYCMQRTTCFPTIYLCTKTHIFAANSIYMCRKKLVAGSVQDVCNNFFSARALV